MSKDIPTCPKCRKPNRLVLVTGFRIECIRSAGGCGYVREINEIEDFWSLFEEVHDV